MSIELHRQPKAILATNEKKGVLSELEQPGVLNG